MMMWTTVCLEDLSIPPLKAYAEHHSVKGEWEHRSSIIKNNNTALKSGNTTHKKIPNKFQIRLHQFLCVVRSVLEQ